MNSLLRVLGPTFLAILGCAPAVPVPIGQQGQMETESGAVGSVTSQDSDSPQAVQARWLRQLAIAMMTHANQDRHGRMLPEGAECWRITLGGETQSYETNQLRDESGKTRLLLITRPGTFFDAEIPKGGTRRMIERSPRAASTIPLILVVGSDRAAQVDEQSDFVFDPSDPKAGMGDVDDPFLVIMADGSVRQFPKSISPAAFTVLCQIEPQMDEAKFAEMKPELERLGLPSWLPRFAEKSNSK